MRQVGRHAFPTQVGFISERRAWDSQAYRGLSTRTHSKEREMELHEIQKGQRLIECSTWAKKTRHGVSGGQTEPKDQDGGCHHQGSLYS